jgi:hypothetical protein
MSEIKHGDLCLIFTLGVCWFDENMTIIQIDQQHIPTKVIVVFLNTREGYGEYYARIIHPVVGICCVSKSSLYKIHDIMAASSR